MIVCYQKGVVRFFLGILRLIVFIKVKNREKSVVQEWFGDYYVIRIEYVLWGSSFEVIFRVMVMKVCFKL